jgi:hypothetical protein
MWILYIKVRGDESRPRLNVLVDLTPKSEIAFQDWRLILDDIGQYHT